MSAADSVAILRIFFNRTLLLNIKLPLRPIASEASTPTLALGTRSLMSHTWRFAIPTISQSLHILRNEMIPSWQDAVRQLGRRLVPSLSRHLHRQARRDRVQARHDFNWLPACHSRRSLPPPPGWSVHPTDPCSAWWPSTLDWTSSAAPSASSVTACSPHFPALYPPAWRQEFTSSSSTRPAACLPLRTTTPSCFRTRPTEAPRRRGGPTL